MIRAVLDTNILVSAAISRIDRFPQVAEHLPADPAELPSCPDPDDRLFLGVAQEAGLLGTGNLRHFPREAWGRARVVSPVAFLADDGAGTT